jgi:hypothetical protein
MDGGKKYTTSCVIGEIETSEKGMKSTFMG